MNKTTRFSLLFLLGMTGFCAGLFAATVTVTNTNDNGAGSLRQAIASAAAGDTINFAASVTSTITLTSGELVINQSNLIIGGPGANVLAVSGNNVSRIFNISTGASATISGLTIRNGRAPVSGGFPGVGGGILISGNLTLSFCAISNKTAMGSPADPGALGGGIFINFGTASIRNCIITGNAAVSVPPNQPFITNNSFGGGIATTGALNITNTTISDNTATGGDSTTGVGGIGTGGGIAYLDSPAGVTSQIDNSTISHNTASGGRGTGGVNSAVGGGIAAEGANPTLNSTIVALNTADGNNGPDINGAPSGSFNLIGNGSGETGITNGTNHNQVGTAAAPIDPKLGSLQDNGGPTLTRALLTGSPALDQGEPGEVTTDQRGFPRTVDDPAIPNALDGTDIGAVEGIQSSSIPVFRNLSARAQVMGGQEVAIGGFILGGGSQTGHRLVLRGIGPSLPSFVPNRLSDPVLTLHHRLSNGSDVVVATNDNWKTDDQTHQSQQAAVEATHLAPGNDNDAVILASLDAPPGGYSVILSGNGSGTGIGLVEIFDIDTIGSSELVNMSTRGMVGTGDDVMIGGVIVGESSAVVITAKGPSLGAATPPVQNPLADPTLTLYDANGNQMAQNDDWQNQDANSVQQVQPFMSTAFPKESALSKNLPAGSYSAIVRGKNGTTGVGLVEFFLNQA